MAIINEKTERGERLGYKEHIFLIIMVIAGIFVQFTSRFK
jgi:hypothetical protein